MRFGEALSYLLALGHETLAMKLGLDSVRALLAALGRPERDFFSVQIAGTNGKGSTAAMLFAAARAAGIRVGLYTSPHLVSITERVRTHDGEMTEEQFAAAVARVRDASEELRLADGALPTFFEQVTAAALLHFKLARVELAILETGLGGRLDATTAAGARVAAVTPVALDHQEHLGDTLAQIAAEKAAIIRPGTTEAVCLAPQQPEAEEVILRRCREANLAPRAETHDVSVVGACEGGRLRATLRTRNEVYENVCLSLRGRHQLTNAALAVELAETLAGFGFAIGRAHVVAGLERAEHAGRLELVAARPPVLLDGAHNAAGARALREYWDEFVSAPVTLVFGAMRDKELGEIARALFPAARELILTRASNARSADPADLWRLALQFPPESGTITVAPTAAEALALARERAAPHGLVCVTGSLYLVGEAKSLLNNSTAEGRSD